MDVGAALVAAKSARGGQWAPSGGIGSRLVHRGRLGEPCRVGRPGLPAAGSDVLGDRGATLAAATPAPVRVGGARAGDVRHVASAGRTERGEGVRPGGSDPAVTLRHAADATPSDPGRGAVRQTGQRALTGGARRAGVRTAGIRRPASRGRRRTGSGADIHSRVRRTRTPFHHPTGTRERSTPDITSMSCHTRRRGVEKERGRHCGATFLGWRRASGRPTCACRSTRAGCRWPPADPPWGSEVMGPDRIS